MSSRSDRLAAISGIAFSGEVFRFINPKYSSDEEVVSGTGGLKSSGRFGFKGSHPVTYTSLRAETALAELTQTAFYFQVPLSRLLLPATLVAMTADLSWVLDLTDGQTRNRLKLSKATIVSTDWIGENRRGRLALTQVWGAKAAQVGFEAALVPSAAEPKESNLIVFPRNLRPNSTFEVFRAR